MKALYQDLLELGSVKIREIEDTYLQLVLVKKDYDTVKAILHRKYNIFMTTLEWILSKAQTHGVSDWLNQVEEKDAYGYDTPRKNK
jgi:hypothetical protein